MAEEISQLKQAEKENAAVESLPSAIHDQRPGEKPSLFGPIILIAIGAYFLASNLGYVEESLYWQMAFSLWPVLLIASGLNMIVRQAPGPVGPLLSGLIGLAVVAFYGAVLLFGPTLPIIRDYAPAPADIHHQPVSVSMGEATSANITIDLSSPATTIGTLNADNGLLIDGQVSHTGEFILDETRGDDEEVSVFIDTENYFGFGWFSTPWSDEDRWELDLNPTIPTDLSVNVGSGYADLNLEPMQLTHVQLDGDSGAVILNLPRGSYEVNYNGGSGSNKLRLPNQGRPTVTIDGGSGSTQIILPFSMEAQIEVEDGSGSFSPGRRFELVEGERNGDGVWQTAGYAGADDRVDIRMSIGSGSVSISSGE